MRWGHSLLGSSEWQKSIYKRAGRFELCSGGDCGYCGWCGRCGRCHHHFIFLSLWLEGGPHIIVTYWWISFIFSWWSIFMQSCSWRFPWLCISLSGVLGRVLVKVVLCHVSPYHIIIIIHHNNAPWACRLETLLLLTVEVMKELSHGTQTLTYLANLSLSWPSSHQPQQSRRGSLVVPRPEMKVSCRAWLSWSLW